jgi:hypothetical protein
MIGICRSRTTLAVASREKPRFNAEIAEGAEKNENSRRSLRALR